MGYKGTSLYGQTLDWHGIGRFSGAKLVYGLLSVGTQEQPDPRHLVDDCQTRINFVYVCVVCVCDGVVCKKYHECICASLCECRNHVYIYMLTCVFVPFLHANSTCVCARKSEKGGPRVHLSHIYVVKKLDQEQMTD